MSGLRASGMIPRMRKQAISLAFGSRTVPEQRLSRLYLLNAALLATHEIDSAYWHEWEMFRIPGGIELFLVINLVLLVLVLYGFTRVIQMSRGAYLFSYLLAGVGIFAFAIHTGFLVMGYPQFQSPVSIGLLFAILVTSITQVVVARQ